MEVAAIIEKIISSPTWIITLALVTAVVYYIFTNWKESRASKRNTKMQQYALFLEKLIAMKQIQGVHGIGPIDVERSKVEFAVSMQVLNLVANKNVLNAVNSYLDCLKAEYEEVGKSQEERYNSLVLAMRADVYGDKHNDDVDKVVELLTIR